MKSFFAALGAAGTLFVLTSCLSDEDPGPFNVEAGEGVACVKGQTQACACPPGPDGVQTCEGPGYGPCTCPSGGSGGTSGGGSGGTTSGGSCTLFPDCDGCVECFEGCLCQSSGDVNGCRDICGLGGGGGSGGSGGSGGAGGSGGGGGDPCEQCAAAQCPAELQACQSTPGCLDIVDCARGSGCATSDIMCILGACQSVIFGAFQAVGPAQNLGGCISASCSAEC